MKLEMHLLRLIILALNLSLFLSFLHGFQVLSGILNGDENGLMSGFNSLRSSLCGSILSASFGIHEWGHPLHPGCHLRRGRRLVLFLVASLRSPSSLLRPHLSPELLIGSPARFRSR